jgi:hypothetical protein
MTGLEPTPALLANRALFNAGLELPGRRLQHFAQRLLAAADASPEDPADELVRHAMTGIEDGPAALVAEEPELRDQPLTPPAATVSEAAETALYALGAQLVEFHRQR